MRLFLFIFICLLATGCRTIKPSTESIHTVKDSTWTVTKYHKKDTVITIPGDVSYITVPIKDVNETPVTKTSGRSTATVKRTGDMLEIVCECAEFKQKIEYLETEITHLQKIIELQKELKTEPYPYVPWYYKILAWIGGIALVLCGGLLAFKLLKR